MPNPEGRVDPASEEEFLAQLYRGGELLAAGKVTEARDHLERAYTLHPRNEKAQNLLGLTYFKLGVYDRAAHLYEKLVLDNPADPTLRVNLGLVYLKSNDLPRCIREFETATDLSPEHKKAHNYLGLALAQAGEYARAREHFVLAGSDVMAEKMATALAAGAQPPQAVQMSAPEAAVPPRPHSDESQIEVMSAEERPPPLPPESAPSAVVAVPPPLPVRAQVAMQMPPPLPIMAAAPAAESAPAGDAELRFAEDEGPPAPPMPVEAFGHTPTGELPMVDAVQVMESSPLTEAAALIEVQNAEPMSGLDEALAVEAVQVVDQLPVVEATTEVPVEVFSQAALPTSRGYDDRPTQGEAIDDGYSDPDAEQYPRRGETQRFPMWLLGPEGEADAAAARAREEQDLLGASVPAAPESAWAAQPGQAPLVDAQPSSEAGWAAQPAELQAAPEAGWGGQPQEASAAETAWTAQPAEGQVAPEVGWAAQSADASVPVGAGWVAQPAEVPAATEAAWATQQLQVPVAPEGEWAAPAAEAQHAELHFEAVRPVEAMLTSQPEAESAPPREAPRPAEPDALDKGFDAWAAQTEAATPIVDAATPVETPAVTGERGWQHAAVAAPQPEVLVGPVATVHTVVTAEQVSVAPAPHVDFEVPPVPVVPPTSPGLPAVEARHPSQVPQVDVQPVDPGYAPVGAPRLAEIGPSLDWSRNAMSGPFLVSRDGLALQVKGELLSRLEGLVAVVGQVDAAPEMRRMRGRASDQPFGQGARQMQRVVGTGVLYLEPGRANFHAINLDDDAFYACEELVFAFEEAVAFENGKLTADGGLGVDLLHLKGQGQVLLRLEGALKTMALPAGAPMVVPLARLVGWYGQVTPRLKGFVGQGAVELVGEGYALLVAPH